MSKPFTGFLNEYFHYDTISRLVKHTDPEGKVTEYEYDANDNLSQFVVDPSILKLTTKYTYDQNDNALSITSPKGHITSLIYDFQTDDLIEENDGLAKKRWKYNQDGSLDSFITKNNLAFKYTYYNQTDFPGTKLSGLFYTDNTTYYFYDDATRNLNLLTNSDGKSNRLVHFSFNRGKWNKPDYLISNGFFTGSTPDIVAHGFDPFGKVSWIAYPSFGGKSFDYDYRYDRATKNIETVSKRGSFNQKYAEYVYKKDGRPLSVAYGNGDTIYYHYDKWDRLDSISAINKNGIILYTIAAELDKNGKHTQEDLKLYFQGNAVTSVPALTLGDEELYSYQSRNTILTGDNRNYQNSNGGQIIAATNPNTDYTWDHYGRLTKIKSGSDSTVYEYDCLGDRRRKNDIYYVVDHQGSGNMIMEAYKNTTPISAYIYGNGLIARVDAVTDSIFYYHFDFRGSVIAITNQAGEMVQYYKYEDYGNIYDSEGTLSWNNPFRYVGKWGVQYDDSEVYYMKARYYQPSTGRFISEDPVWNTNLFVYGDDDPINNIDPSGLFSITGEVGFGESLIPVWGNWRQAMYYSDQGNYGMAALYTAGAIGDVVGIGYIAKGVVFASAGTNWAKTSGILRAAVKGKGNYGLGTGTFDEAMQAGRSWVGKGYTISKDGSSWISANGLRQFRPPSFKPKVGVQQANFEWRKIGKGAWQSNGHLDIIKP